MNSDFPIPINTETDLDLYENYLKQEFKTSQIESFTQKLKSYIGNFVKVECLAGNRIEAKIGSLLEVGEDFILLKQMQTGQKTMICNSTVKFVTILKSNPQNRYL